MREAAMTTPAPAQLGFDALLAEAETVNRQQEAARAAAHLPGTMAEALPCFRDLQSRHHAAMLAADVETALSLRAEARELALKLNGGRRGILADKDAPGCVLARETAAAPGTVPLWGQRGDFETTHNGMRVRIKMDGIFGIGASAGFWIGFEAFAVDLTRPFLSETGYRSFLGCGMELAPGITPESFAAAIIGHYVTHTLKGRLKAVEACPAR
jgi:hypothetical protein